MDLFPLYLRGVIPVFNEYPHPVYLEIPPCPSWCILSLDIISEYARIITRVSGAVGKGSSLSVIDRGAGGGGGTLYFK